MTDTDILLVDDPRPRVRRLTLNRPDKRNALNNARRGRILEALEDADLDPEIHMTAIRGAGPGFSSGYDLSADRQFNKRAVHRAMETMRMRDALRQGTEIQALAFTSESSRAYRDRFRRDGSSVTGLLRERDTPFD